MFKYSFCNLVWFKEEKAKSVNRLARCGYDAIELYGEPSAYNYSQFRTVLKDNGMEVSNICALYSDQRDLAHPDEGIRSNAREYVKSVVDMAAEIGAKTFGITPTSCMKTKPLANPEDELKWAVGGIREAAELAQSHGVRLVLETWNRYEHYWLNRLDQCLELARQVGHDNVGVMGDTFHMNIEEASMPDAIKLAGGRLWNIHLADSNRAAVGEGHIDFEPVIQALIDIGYKDYISYEILPGSADPFGVLEKGVDEKWYDRYAEQCIANTKRIEQKLRSTKER
jgi:sugar phosphate isomerase/epimerase